MNPRPQIPENLAGTLARHALDFGPGFTVAVQGAPRAGALVAHDVWWFIDALWPFRMAEAMDKAEMRLKLD